MSTHAIGTKGRLRPAAVGIVLASVVAVSALTAEARLVWSGSAKVPRPAIVRIDPYAAKDDKGASWLRPSKGTRPSTALPYERSGRRSRGGDTPMGAAPPGPVIGQLRLGGY